ncbi:MAG: hypothetical protein ACD_79C00732G0003 [uncultured bacterium]|nr:MAG: hypothetical protein ACD_79C00732G0003 [uncultured bacterium]
MSKNEKIAYGMHPVEELVNSGLLVKRVYFSQDKKSEKFDELKNILQENKIPFTEKSDRFIEKLCGSPNHQGIIAMFTPQERELCFKNKNYTPRTGNFLCLYLDRIQDPHNFGAIVRTSEFFLVDQIFYPEHNNAPFNSVALKASAGGGFHNPPYRISSVTNFFENVASHDFQVIGTNPTEGKDFDEIDFTQNTLLIVGNEGEGISRKTTEYCTDFIKLPSESQIQSLNVSVFTGIILYHIYKQRIEN